MVFDQRAKAKKYKPIDGDTLEKIAQRESTPKNPLTASDIARFNWGTEDLEVVDEHLRDELGCYKRGPDKRFVISSDAPVRKDLLIPQLFEKAGFATDKTYTLRVSEKESPPKQFAACARVRGVCFEYDKSFIRPTVVDDLEILNQLAKKHPDSKVMIFGHTDKVGPAQYNKDLSERRALSTYAFITNDADMWEKLYHDENWGIRAVQAILNDLGGDFDPGAVDGVDGPSTQAAVKKYQEARGLTVDGKAGPETRKKLFAEYMTSKHDIKLDPDRFMNPKHMGCSECNPVVETEEKCEANRRVTFFFFHRDRLPNLVCKHGKLAPCNQQTAAPLPRHTETFHCSLYDSLAKNCPTEAGIASVTEPPGIDIELLDKWFIPGAPADGGETCRIRYSLMGRKEKASSVTLEVYASNYCNAQVNGDGTFTFTRLASPAPVFARDLPDEFARPGEEHEITDWHGEVTAADGALKASEGKERHVNAAFSPYTVHLRYLEKGAADTEARILLEDFWPRWKKQGGADALQAGSLKLRWRIEKTEALKVGKLLIVDKADAVVFEKDLAEADLKKGEFDWDGMTLAGTEASPDRMPYRVQIQARTGDGEAKGLAVAAMHTEIRIFVDPGTHLDSDQDYNPAGDPQAFDIGMGPLIPQPEAPTRDQGTIWCQHRLARSGFHPGPVDGANHDEYKLALKEFQRSVPRRKANPADAFQRLTPDGSESSDTKDAIEDLPASPLRPWFGDPSSAARDDLSNEDAETILADRDKELIVWVDDRHAYTQSDEAEISGHASYMNNYRGGMEIADIRVAKDNDSIARPWLPLQAGPLVLRRDAGLEASDRPALNDAIRKAVGPIRIDWTFDEIGPDTSVIDPAMYNKDRTRTRKYVDWILDQNKKTHRRKDTVRDAAYTNCPEDCGGIRPGQDNPSQYMSKAFGHGDRRLRPWLAAADDDVESIATVVHDDLGQAADKYFEALAGRAGVYFHPSHIAGDGYRVRARVRFRKCAGYDFPNLEVLARRYPRLPQAHTAGLRIWRKSSIRAYVRWAPAATGHWDGFMAKYRSLYAAAHVHFVYEAGPNAAPPGTATEYNLSDLLDPANNGDRTVFADIIRNRVQRNYHKNNPGHIRMDEKYLFPWHHLAHLDWPWPAPANTALGDLYDRLYGTIFTATWRAFRDRLLNELLRRAEAKYGRLRGHFLVEFLSTPKYWVEEYNCDGCGDRYWWIETAAAGGSATGKSCPDCGGQMQRQNPVKVRLPGFNSFPLPAAGTPLAATWLFTSSTEETWAHEVGHHRHMEHAASAPVGPRTEERKRLHDTEANTHKAWAAGVAALGRQWDRCCIMSYTSDSEKLYFCGKCVLRNRGWKVEGLGHPGTGEHDA